MAKLLIEKRKNIIEQVNKDELINLRKQFTLEDIAKESGVSYYTLRKILVDVDNEIKKTFYKKPKESICDKFKDEIIILLKDKRSIPYIAEKLKIDQNTLYHYINLRDLKIKI